MPKQQSQVEVLNLVSDLEGLSKDGKSSQLLSPQEFYKIGLLMSSIDDQKARDSDLHSAYQHLTETIPESCVKRAFSAYYKGFITLMGRSPKSLEDLEEATEALSGLLSRSSRICRLVYSRDWMSLLASVYDVFVLNKTPPKNRSSILASISFLILDGLFLESAVDERILATIRTIEEQSIDCLKDLQEWQSSSEPFGRTFESSVRSLPIPLDDDNDSFQQREYILSMLESAKQIETSDNAGESKMKSESRKPNSSVAKRVAPADELERRIKQVKQILPDLGEGFIEAALSLNKGDVETTLSILINDPSQYPTALRALDRSLPRRKKDRAEEEKVESAEAREVVKARIAAEQKQEEERYQALLYVEKKEREEMEVDPGKRSEYDDDYDDQYDEIDVKFGMDEGMYDFENVKLYNQVVRQEEAEDSFWEENRNTNRSNKNQGKGKPSDDGAKQYRGPDKIKGGRIVGPDGKIVRNRGRGKKGGKGGKGNETPPATQPQNTPGSTQNDQKKKNHRTKPKANNKVNRQRDRKQKAQGNFGGQS